MRTLFATQSDSLRVFESLRAALDARVGVERAGFVVADSLAYGAWLREHPSFERSGHLILKEWEVTARRRDEPDLQRLRRYEEQLGTEAGLFGALVADRRLFMGRDCTYSQDYRRRFSDRELLSILQSGLVETERLFDELRPALVVGFICVTMLDYLVYLFARARGVRYLNLRPTRVGDRVTLGSILNDPTPEFVQAYRCARERRSPYLDEARKYIKRVREQHGRYEGVVRPSAKPALKVNARGGSAAQAALRWINNYWAYRAGPAATDNHVPNPIRTLLFAGVVNPVRARYAAHRLGSQYADPSQLQNRRFAFYPLHTEPEVSLLVYGRPFVNQIEIIRALAMSLPVDMVLVVKEHPWMVGKRTYATYRKLLNIPRVRLVDPSVEARDLIAGAALVAVVTGSVALEAAMLGKPVLTFGDCPYNALPETMVQRCRDLRRLPGLLRQMLDGYVDDEQALEAYLAATWETSESINLYSVLLQKRGVYADRSADAQGEVEKLADYTLRCLQSATPATFASATW